MEGKANNQGYTYEEFEPLCKWQRKEDRDILELHLQEFKREQLKVQISNHGMLKICGERSLVDPSKKSKFYKEVQLSSKYDTLAINAKFINGWLQVTLPKTKFHVPEKHEKPQTEPSMSKVDQTPKPESKTPTLNDTKDVSNKKKIQTVGGSASTILVKKCRLAKTVMTLTATAAMVTVLVAYFVYMYKSTILENDDL